MAIAQGFGKTTHNNLIFGYDTGDMDNSFKGAPKTNLLSQYSRSYGNQSSSLFKTQYYSRDVFVPTLGIRTVETLETYNDYGGGSGVCCQGAWYLGGSGVSGSTQYTYSIIYRSSSGYTHPNFMYRYEYGASGYITEGGLHNNGNRTHLGDGWYHAWGNMTTQPGTTSMSFYFYMYEYATYNTIDIAGVMFTQGPEILRPRQFIPFSTTRSVTQGLLDLTGNGTINLANVSYTGTGELIFDGSDDYLDLGSDITISPANQGWTAEYVFNTDSASTLQHFNSAEADDFNANWLAILSSKMAVWNVSPGYWKYGSTVFQNNTWYHIAFVCDAGGTNMRFYVNGVAEGGDHVGNSWTSAYSALKTRYIGRYEYAGSYSRHFDGKIAIARLYNRVLTQAELTQNYSHYKTRFNL